MPTTTPLNAYLHYRHTIVRTVFENTGYSLQASRGPVILSIQEPGTAIEVCSKSKPGAVRDQKNRCFPVRQMMQKALRTCS
jgi:hypothetical protein